MSVVAQTDRNRIAQIVQDAGGTIQPFAEQLPNGTRVLHNRVTPPANGQWNFDGIDKQGKKLLDTYLVALKTRLDTTIKLKRQEVFVVEADQAYLQRNFRLLSGTTYDLQATRTSALREKNNEKDRLIDEEWEAADFLNDQVKPTLQALRRPVVQVAAVPGAYSNYKMVAVGAAVALAAVAATYFAGPAVWNFVTPLATRAFTLVKSFIV